MIPQFPVYLFDVDGTLLDSAQDICGAVQCVLANAGRNGVQFDFLKGYIGLHLVDLFQDVFPGCSPDQADAWVEEYRTIYRSRGHKATRVFPGVVDGLAALGGRKSTATTKGTPMTRSVLEQFDLLPYFDHVQGTDGFPAKPEPHVIQASLEVFKAKPEECLLVGDSAADMAAGRRAGVRICAVRYGYGNVEQMAAFEPDFWIDDLRELSAERR